MQIVTLTTDWGLSDYYVGVVKGRLYSLINDVLVVDITHNIESYDLDSTAFIVKNACSQYPDGTIHIIDVNSYEHGEMNGLKPQPYVAIKHNNQYYICTDNKLPSRIFGNDEIEITDINLYNETDFYTFAALDLFPKVAKMIAENHNLDNIGNKLDRLYNQQLVTGFSTKDNDSVIIAKVIHIDKYGNVFLNVKDVDFRRIKNGRQFKIRIGFEEITKMSLSYADVECGQPLLTVSSSGYLQLAVREDSISSLLSIREDSSIYIQFY